MSKLTFSKADGKRSKVELVVDRKVVDQAYIDEKNPLAFFTAEYVNMADRTEGDMSVERMVEKKKCESNMRKAEAYLCEFFRLLAIIRETDPDAVEELLEILTESLEASKAGISEDEDQA